MTLYSYQLPRVLGPPVLIGAVLAASVVLSLGGCSAEPKKNRGDAGKQATPIADETKTPATDETADLPPAADMPPASDAQPAPIDTVAPIDTAAANPAEPAKSQSNSDAEHDPEKVLLGSPDLTAGIPGAGPLKVEEIESWLDKPANMEVLAVELPLGLSLGAQQIKGLDKNPLTRAKIELGRQLYFDPRLSADGSVSCASCHHPDTGWAARTQFGVGINEQTGGRNSPVSFNRILSDAQFWDGRAPSLEAQAIGPIANPIEMGNTHEACVDTLRKIPGYELEFNKIFGKLTIETVGEAIASFERAVVTSPSPYDYYERFQPLTKQDPDDLKSDDPELYDKYVAYKKDMDEHPMSETAIRGRTLFFGEKANCTACHAGPNFSDEQYHNLGVGMDQPEPDLGRELISKKEADRGAFKTPTIRNAAHSAPYMHDGSQKTLEEVVEWYAKGGHPNPYLDLKIKKLDLTAQDKADLVAFMDACTGDFPKIERDRLPE